MDTSRIVRAIEAATLPDLAPTPGAQKIAKRRGRPKGATTTPSYRLHKSSGQAVVTIPGRPDVYLGKHGTQESRSEYDRVIGEWLASGRQVLVANDPATTVSQILAAWWKENESTRTKNDLTNFRMCFRHLQRLYGNTKAVEFGPLKLKALRQQFIAQKAVRNHAREAGVTWTRRLVNQAVWRVRFLFKWAVANELIPATTIQALLAVPPLRPGEGGVREGRKVGPVRVSDVDATLEQCSPPMAAMIRLQLLTGMRSTEVCIMRTGDIDRTGGDVWMYRPAFHKTQRHGHSRAIPLGPKAQEILSPWLKLDPKAYIFTPRDEWYRRRENRIEKVGPVRAKYFVTKAVCRGAKIWSATPPKRYKERYDRTSYRENIAIAVRRANAAILKADPNTPAEQLVQRWHPHQLRHTAATYVRKHYGPEAAQALLGHASLKVTEIYAEVDNEKASQVMREVG